MTTIKRTNTGWAVRLNPTEAATLPPFDAWAIARGLDVWCPLPLTLACSLKDAAAYVGALPAYRGDICIEL